MSYHAMIRFGAAALAMFLVSCGSDEEPEVVLRPVRYQQVFSTGGSRTRTFSGTAQASLESSLSFKVAGTIEQLPVQVGDSVKSGQLLAALDDEDYRVQVQEAEAALARTRAQKRNTEANYERVRLLYENNTASKSELDGARANYESAAATVEASDQRLQLARLQLSYTRLTAPVAGAVAAVDVEVNENMNPGQTIVMLTSGARHKVEVGIPEVLIAQIRAGAPVMVTFDALPDRTFTASVTEVGVAATGMGTMFPATVLLDEADPDIRSGMAAEVAFRFESSDRRERFIVPAYAVSEDRDGRFVYVVEPTEDGVGVVRRRAVDVGELTTEGIEIFEGLSDGDLLITAGVSRIQDGLAVRVQVAEQES